MSGMTCGGERTNESDERHVYLQQICSAFISYHSCPSVGWATDGLTYAGWLHVGCTSDCLTESSEGTGNSGGFRVMVDGSSSSKGAVELRLLPKGAL